MTGNFFH